MCTLAIELQRDGRWPVIVAANRDERLGRPAEGWAIRDMAGARVAAPLDLAAGGTWIGVSPAGLFAAVTNLHVAGGGPDPTRRSRGELVPLALARGGLAGVRRWVERSRAADYNPFHLVVADSGGGLLWRYDGRTSHLDELGPGLHVITEASHDGSDARAELVRTRWPSDPAPERLAHVLTIHLPGRTGTCIHADPAYGTRSATVLRLAREPTGSQLFTADGHPCTSRMEDRSALLVRLPGSLDTPTRSGM